MEIMSTSSKKNPENIAPECQGLAPAPNGSPTRSFPTKNNQGAIHENLPQNNLKIMSKKNPENIAPKCPAPAPNGSPTRSFPTKNNQGTVLENLPQNNPKIMSTSSKNNPENIAPKCQGPAPAPNGSPTRSFPTKNNQGTVHENVPQNNPKVKKRKTKKERNCLKFKSHNETFQKKSWPPCGLSRQGGVSNIKAALQSFGKHTLNPKKVFITQNRLTQHHGIFNREVKSINVERFVREATEAEVSKKSAGTSAAPSQKPPSLKVSLGLLLTPEKKKKKDKIPSPNQSPVQMVVEESESAPDSEKPKENRNPEPSETCNQGKVDHPQISPSGSRTRSPPGNLQEVPVHEVAESITNMLSSLPIFRGRNLLKETRLSIMEMRRQLSSAGSHGSGQRETNYANKANTPTPPYSRWHCSREERRDSMKTAQRPQSPMEMMQTSPVRFMPMPTGSPVHTLMKRVNPERRLQRLSPVFHHPVVSDPPQRQHPLSSERSPHLFNILSSSRDSGPNRRAGNAVTFHRANKHSDEPGNADSPQIRWKLSGDDLLYKHDVLQENVTYSDNPTNQTRLLDGQPDVSRPLFVVPQNMFEQNPTPQIFGDSLTSSRTCYPVSKSPFPGYLEGHRHICPEDPESHRHICPEDRDRQCHICPEDRESHRHICPEDRESPRHICPEDRDRHRHICPEDPESHRHICPEDPESHRHIYPEDRDRHRHICPEDRKSHRHICPKDLTSRYQSDHPMGLRNLNLNSERVPYRDSVPIKYMPRWRNIYGDCSTWSPLSSHRHRRSIEENEWQVTNHWSASHQWRKRPITVPVTTQQDIPFLRSSKGLLDRTSPEVWKYPRMKLY